MVVGRFDARTRVFEGTLALHPPTSAKSTIIKLERHHTNTSDCSPCRLISDPPTFLLVDRVIKDDPGHPAHEVVEQGDWNAPTQLAEGVRVRIFIQGKFWTLLCPLESAPTPPSCEQSNRQLTDWQSVQAQIATVAGQGNADALLRMAGALAKTDPNGAVRALSEAMDHGAVVTAGSRAADLLLAQARYPEAIAVLDRVITAEGTAASPDLLARRELARAASGHTFSEAKVDFSHSTLNKVHLGPASLRDRTFNGVDWSDVRLNHVDFSGLRSKSFKIEGGALDHVSFNSAVVVAGPQLGDGSGRVGRALAVGPDWNGKPSAPTSHDVVKYAQATAITAFALQLTRPAFSIHASIIDSDFTRAVLPHAEINGSWGEMVRLGEAATRWTAFDGSDLEAAGIGGRLDHVSFKDTKLDWAEFSRATLDHVSFEGASLVGTEFAVVDFRGVDFSHAKTWKYDVTVEGVAHRLNKNLIIDPILGLRFDPETFGRSTYDCATKWPIGFDPTPYGLVPTRASCALRQTLDFDGMTLNGLRIDNGQDFSGASFRGAKLQVHCRRGSLRDADFTNAQFGGSASGCDLTNALFDHASVSATLVGSTLEGTRFIDSTIEINAISSFSFGGFWTQKPPDPSSRTFTDLPGAMFLRSRIVCTGAEIGSASQDKINAAFRSLHARGMIIDTSCPITQPPSLPAQSNQ